MSCISETLYNKQFFYLDLKSSTLSLSHCPLEPKFLHAKGSKITYLVGHKTNASGPFGNGFMILPVDPYHDSQLSVHTIVIVFH